MGLTPPMPDAAYYLAGYAVECALKACIAKSYNQHDWPEKQFVSDGHTHSLSRLLQLAKLDVAFLADTSGNPDLGQNWTIVKDWNERARYERHSDAEAQQLIDAMPTT